MNTMPQASSTASRIQGRRPAAVLALALLLALTACGQRKSIVFPPETPPTARPQPVTPVTPGVPLQQQAQEAWKKGDMPGAERYYGLLANTPGLPEDQQREAWRFHAAAAAANRHPHVALDSLQRWRALEPQADGTTEWQDTWYSAVGQLPREETIRRAGTVYGDTARPWPLRAQAGLLLSTRQWENGTTAASLKTLSDLYGQATPTWRAALENRLYEELAHTDPTTMQRLRGTVTPENEGTYPYNVILLEQARRLVAAPGGSGSATDVLARLQSKAHFEDPQLLGALLTGGQTGPAARCVALALPMSGPFGPIGWKVARGASSAQWELARTGQDTEVRVLNTEAPDWIAQVEALPEACTVVGGPLRTTTFTQARDRGLTQKRVFFTFVPQLEEGEEGSVAWRFFTSPEDQIAALLRFTRDDLGITAYGALYPDEVYGRRMASLFSQQVAQGGGNVQRSTSYPPSRPEEWNGVAASFVGTRKVNDYPVPSATFRAVFLPDGWKHMESLVPNLFYHGEDRQVLLGTSLWEQGLSGQKKVDVHNFGLAVFPGAWNAATPTSAGIALADALRQAGLEAPDAWVGLGYDFVRLSSRLGIQSGWTPATVNAALSHTQGMSWSIAPMHWSADGRATQDLFLFTPSEEGFEPIDASAFKARYERVRERHEQRVKAAAAPKQ